MLMTERSDDKYAFDTHLNYITAIRSLCPDLSVSYTNKIIKLSLPELKTKENVISLTNKSLADEYKIIQEDAEYSFASTSWLPVKAYYLIFNFMLTAEYCINPQTKSFKISHTRLISIWNSRLKKGEIVFSEKDLGIVYGKEILDFILPKGSTFKNSTSKDDLYKSAMKMIARYKYEDWKSGLKVKLGSKEGQVEKQEFLDNLEVSIFDYFYQMRIRSNYRDFAFISGVTSQDTKKYFEIYYSITKNICDSLSKLSKQIQSQRLK